MKRLELKKLIKEIVTEEVGSYVEKKTLNPIHMRNDTIIGKFFDNDEFQGRISVINGTHLPLDVKVEKMNNPETSQQSHLITITTKIPEPLIQQIKRMITSK